MYSGINVQNTGSRVKYRLKYRYGYPYRYPALMLVCLSCGSAQTMVHAATLRVHKLPIILAISPSYSKLTPDQPVLEPTLQLLGSTIIANALFTVMARPGNVGFDPRISRSGGDALPLCHRVT